MRGCVCRWCGEAVTEADERYEAMDGTAVAADSLAALMLAPAGGAPQAERMRYAPRRDVQKDAERREGL